MKKFRTNKIIKIRINGIIVLLIIFLTIFLFKYITDKLSPKLYAIITEQLNYNNNKIIMECIESDDLIKQKLTDILNITKNKNDEILTIDYNMEITYKVLNLVSDEIKKELYNSNFDKGNHYYQRTNDGMILFYPIGMVFNNAYFNNLGPKIPVKILYLPNMITSLNTKITNYGINNVLVEIYLNVTIKNNITIPVSVDNINNDYSVLLAAKVIVGKVPSFMGNTLENSSPQIKS